MKHNILITGASGFIGSHLCKRFEKENISYHKFEGDILDFENVQKQLEKHRFTAIFHLAAFSSPQECEGEPEKAFSINVNGTFNLLECLKRSNHETKFIFLSTAHVYAPANDEDGLIDESFPVRPQSVYGMTKLLSENLIEHYFESSLSGEGVIYRLFNHTHSSQEGPFFFPQLYQKIKKLQGSKGIVEVGNLDIHRDFSLISDLINLLFFTLNATPFHKTKVFNVCSGKPRHLKKLAQELASQLGAQVEFKPDPEKFRDEPKKICGSNLRLQEYLQHKPHCKSDHEFVEHFLKPID